MRDRALRGQAPADRRRSHDRSRCRLPAPQRLVALLLGALAAATAPQQAEASAAAMGSQPTAYHHLRVPDWDPRHLRDTELDTNIVGGQPTSDPHHLFTVSLQTKFGKTYSHNCGGSIIHQRWILTAGHCVKYGSPARIAFGSPSLSSGAMRSRKVDSGGLFRHPMYYGVTNDLALLRLDEPITDMPIIGLSSEMNGEIEKPNTEMSVTGWGFLEQSSGKTPDQLNIVQVPVVSEKDCSNAYNGISERNICAGYKQGEKDSCQGDSGGPLFFSSAASFTQVGIVSFGRGCAKANYYGVYTRISFFYDWIVKTLRENGGYELPNLTNTKAPTPSPVPHFRSACNDIGNKKDCRKTGGECTWVMEAIPALAVKAKTCQSTKFLNDGPSSGSPPAPAPAPAFPSESPTIAPTASPTTHGFAKELKFCRGLKKLPKCSKSSRCAWNLDTGTGQAISTKYPGKTCLPRELVLSEIATESPTASPRPEMVEGPSAMPTTSPTPSPTAAPTVPSKLQELIASERAYCHVLAAQPCLKRRFGSKVAKILVPRLKGTPRCFMNGGECDSSICDEANIVIGPAYAATRHCQ